MVDSPPPVIGMRLGPGQFVIAEAQQPETSGRPRRRRQERRQDRHRKRYGAAGASQTGRGGEDEVQKQGDMTERVLLPSRGIGERCDLLEAALLITGLFFNASRSAAVACSRALSWAHAASRPLALSCHRALLASKKRTRCLSRFSPRFDARVLAFHLLRLIAKNLTSFPSGLL
jgi:hypothetical protein